MTEPSLAAALRACAAGLHPAEAAAELLIATPWPCRHDFRGRFIRTGTSITDGTTPMAVTDWAAAIAALSAGQLPCSGAERRLLRLAASLGDGIPVDLQDALTSLDDVRLELVTTTIRHAAGRRPATWNWLEETGQSRSFHLVRRRVISVNDPEARHTRKSPEARRDGYRAHVSAEPATGLVTDEQLTRAAGPDNSDAAVAAQMIARETQTAEVYGDSAYGTGGLRAALTRAGHQVIIKPGPLKPAVEGGFTLDDFTVDETAGTVTCPAGITRPISARRNVTFGTACRGCPLRARCTTSKHGRALILHEHDALLRAARADWATQPGLRENYRKHRPNVERVISQIASRGGRRLRLRYRGTAKNNAWLKHRTATLNLRNLISRGLTREHGTWVLA